jgi:hypothetical protein
MDDVLAGVLAGLVVAACLLAGLGPASVEPA